MRLYRLFPKSIISLNGLYIAVEESGGLQQRAERTIFAARLKDMSDTEEDYRRGGKGMAIS